MPPWAPAFAGRTGNQAAGPLSVTALPSCQSGWISPSRISSIRVMNSCEFLISRDLSKQATAPFVERHSADVHATGHRTSRSCTTWVPSPMRLECVEKGQAVHAEQRPVEQDDVGLKPVYVAERRSRRRPPCHRFQDPRPVRQACPSLPEKVRLSSSDGRLWYASFSRPWSFLHGDVSMVRGRMKMGKRRLAGYGQGSVPYQWLCHPRHSPGRQS